MYNAWQYKPVVLDDGTVPLIELPWLILFMWPIVVIFYNHFIRAFDDRIEAWFQRRYGLSFDLREETAPKFSPKFFRHHGKGKR